MSKAFMLIKEAERLIQDQSGTGHGLPEAQRQAIHYLVELYKADASEQYPAGQYDKFSEFYLLKEQEYYTTLEQYMGADDARNTLRVIKTMVYQLNDEDGAYDDDEVFDIGLVK